MTSAPDASSDGAGSARSTFWPLVQSILAAAAAGIGVLGFVTLAGGVVMFERFSAAGLPAEHGVAVVPKDDLLSVGAHALLPLAIVVVVAAIALWLVFVVGPTVTTPRRAASDPGEATDSGDAEGATEGGRITPDMVELPVIGFVLAAVTFAWYLYSHVGPRPDLRHAALVVVAAAAAASAFCLTWYRVEYPNGFPANRSHLHLTRKSLLYVATVGTVGVLLVGLVIVWAKTAQRPNVQPVAVVTSPDGAGVWGLLVAETNGDVYVASVQGRHDDKWVGRRSTGAIMEIPRQKVIALLIGTNQSLPVALRIGPHLLARLGEQVRASKL